MEDASSDETSKGRGEDVTGVKDSNAGGDLLAVVEHREEVDSTRVVRSLCDTQEEASEQKARKVRRQSSQSGDDSPKHHADTHVTGRPSAVQEHVAGNLTKQITDEQDGNAGLILCAGEVEFLLKVVQAGKSDSVTIEVVEPVHGPQHRHDPSIELLDKSDFPGVGFLDKISKMPIATDRWGHTS